MPAEDKEQLVQQTLTAKKFLSLFPWKVIVKFYVFFLIYTVVGGVVFFSTEQCLSEHNNHARKQATIVENPPLSKKKNCSSIEMHYGAGIHEHDGKSKENGVINIQKCENEATGNEATKKKCKLNAMIVMQWMYFVVLHFHGTDTLYLRMKSTWSQTISGPIIIVGVAIAMRIYTLVGFIGVNLLNFAIRKLRAQLRLYRKESLKYGILLAASALQGFWVLFCAAVSVPYAKESISFRILAFKWMLLLTTISDENLVPDSFTEHAQHVVVPIILVFIGYLFTSTFVAAAVNCKYRLTYTVNMKMRAKKTGLQGWL